MENLFIARQPIYDLNQTVMGYELLYRNGNVDKAIFEDANQASCETIINSFMHIGIDSLIGSALAFINLPNDFLVIESLTPMFREQTVLEILEDIEPTTETIEGIKRLKSQGYRIALDDFEYDDKFIPFLNLADYVKIDVLGKDEATIRQQLNTVSKFDVTIIAEKVETQEMYTLCKEINFEYFQGFFFCRPQLVTQKHIPTNKAVALNLLNKLQNPDIDFNELESILAQDIALSYKFLRYINSAAFSLRREIDSIKDAITLLGLVNTRNWVSMILMTRSVDSKPDELITIAMIRGKMCELLAEKNKPDIKAQMFIVGLFSVLDALMDMEMIDLLDTIILSSPIKIALLDHSGDHGAILEQVLQYEAFNWDELIKTGIESHIFTDSYLEAVNWTKIQMAAIK
ncbi:MAG: HDOD domain-containing protein [Gammaproteobacteria bacterium]|nr:HDOD domain-containing protein [Gammaproteobacteria bacterium]MCW8910835.1 HDOD domain-containing protein [Gammaproteobacteria bacterium]MCW9005042.1 HDOD domain-containing protein [Gammaproteobacteria bacterium]